MSPINEIEVPNITIPNVVSNQQWLNSIPNIPSNHPPITTNIGFPIVEIPGCVTMHEDDQDKITGLPFDKDLVNQDPKGTTTLCPHGEYPSYEAMEYTPEKRTRDLEEKALGLDATNWMKKNLEETIAGDEELTIRTELQGGVGKYGRLLGWLYVGDDEISLNEQMITEGYAWAYDGGTKKKDFEELREIRRSFGTLSEG